MTGVRWSPTLVSVLGGLAALTVACAPTAAPTSDAAGNAATSTARDTPSPRSDEAEDDGIAPSASEPGTPVPSSTPDSAGPGSVTFEPIVDPDPGYKDELSNARISTFYWRATDFSRHSVPFDEIFSGGPPPDGIPSLDQPKFTTITEADSWIGDLEPVIVLQVGGETKAYPLQIMTWHEIANDEVGGVPVAVTFCPLCNSAIAFDRRLEGAVLDFGTSGNLRNSDLVMYDRQTKSWWQQFTGESIVGTLTGRVLTMLPSSIVSWDEFKAAHPDGKVLSRDTGFDRSYGVNPYAGYDRADNPPFLFRGDPDGRLLPKERVAAVSIDGVDVAFPFSVLNEERVVHYTAGERDLVVFYTPGAQSALDDRSIGESRSVGATGVFEPYVDGQKLTFKAVGHQRFRDAETGSEWNILGLAVAGPLQGTQLTPIVHANHFWFAWAAFKADTIIYQGRTPG